MKILTLLFSLTATWILLTSASSKPLPSTPLDSSATHIATPRTLANLSAPKKMGFFKRLVWNRYVKKFRKYEAQTGDPVKADKLAKSSLILGIISVALLFIPWYTLLLIVPLSIIAMSNGREALIMGTTKGSAARTGKTMGLISLIGLGVWIIIGTIYAIAVTGWALGFGF
jgi:hypothetical protein